MKCVLDLIDLAWMEEYITNRLAADYLPLNLGGTIDAPKEYWDGLRREIDMADKIIVNSEWSKKIWMDAGVPEEKMVEIPLVYEAAESTGHSGLGSDITYPLYQQVNVSDSRHRLQALFLGSLILRKGVGQLFDAIRMLKNEPVDFIFAGPIGVKIPDDILHMPNVRFLGPVDKSMAQRLYRKSDVFLFPTLSDGFGLTQLEALAHGLPVIASTHCGQVVEDRVSGLVLPEVTPASIADMVVSLSRDEALLAELKSNAKVPLRCVPEMLVIAFRSLEQDLQP
jgi:glycosyltransferase involved in cell wall biosynthesis